MKISELIEELIDGYINQSCQKGNGFVCLTLQYKNEQLRKAGDYDSPKYDVDGFLNELISLLTHEVSDQHAKIRGLPYCMHSDDFDHFAEIGARYVSEDFSEHADSLSESMKSRIGLLVHYGLDKDVPVRQKSE